MFDLHSKPTVTIGMCIKNGEKFLKNSIESIMLQDYPKDLMQIIFVDDGSTDKTLQIIRNYLPKLDIKAKIFSTEWRGTGPARNLILKNTVTKYILWVDSDMILTKSYTKLLVDFMEKNDNFGIVMGSIKIINPNNVVLTLDLLPMSIKFEQDMLFNNSILKNLPGTGGALYRVDAAKKIGGFDEKIKGAGEDQYAAQKIKNDGWLLGITSGSFSETHGNMLTWIDLLKKYYWHGYTSYDLYNQKKHPFILWRMSPVAGFVFGCLIVVSAYRKIPAWFVFLLPVHFFLKSCAWCIGFTKNQFSNAEKNK